MFAISCSILREIAYTWIVCVRQTEYQRHLYPVRPIYARAPGTTSFAFFLFPDSFHRGKWNGLASVPSIPDIVRNSPITRPCAVAPLNVVHLPEGFIGNRYRDAWNVHFKGMIDGGGGTRGQADEKQRGRQQTTTTENRRGGEGKEGWGETQGKRKNGKINCRKVVRSITCRARPRVIFVRINKSSHVEYTRVARCYKRVQSERRWLQRVEKKVACHAY